MNFTKRAFISITRNFKNYGLLFSLVFILGTAGVGAISINRAVEISENDIIHSMTSIAQVVFDWNVFLEEPDFMFTEEITETLSPELIREIGKLSYVRDYDFFVETWGLYGLNLKEYEPKYNGAVDNDFEFGHVFILRGSENPNLFDLEQGIIELVAGRTFTDVEMRYPANVALVSENFANLNHLAVGSIITFCNIVFRPQDESEWDTDHFTRENIFAHESYDLEVIGIFRIVNILDTGDSDLNNMLTKIRENRIYVSNAFAEKVVRFMATARLESFPTKWNVRMDGSPLTVDDFITAEHLFVLNSPLDFPAFRTAVSEIVSPYYHVVDANGTLHRIASAVEAMRVQSSIAFRLVIGAYIVILLLLIMLFLRDRKREVGIYLSLGERRSRIVAQFLLEIIAVTFAGIVIALFIGNIFSLHLSRNVLESSLILQHSSEYEWERLQTLWGDNPFMTHGYKNVVNTDNIIASFDTSLNITDRLIFVASALGVTMLATIVPLVCVVRLNPNKIVL